MRRSKHTLSHYRLTSGDMGKLLPIGCVEVLPGDTFQHNTDVVVRMAPMNAPVMHPTRIRIHHFFVPNRILWDGWEDFITGDAQQGNDNIPTITQSSTENSLLEYLGVPNTDGLEVNALPVRAYNRIYNDWFRDQDVGILAGEDSVNIQNVAWEKDYFTTCRPWTQKGAAVSIPITGKAEVRYDGTVGDQGKHASVKATLDNNNPRKIGQGTDGFTYVTSTTGSDVNSLYADLSTASSVNINDFRTAFALQRYQEARARYGSRYVEYLRYLGISPSDQRLSRPELLGSSTTMMNFSEVLQTGVDTRINDGAQVGELYGHGIAGMRGNRYRKFFEEHGYVITLMSVRPKSIYMNMVPKTFLRKVKEDYWQKELETVGQQAVQFRELASFHATPDATFGFQDRYREYREQPSQVSCDLTRTYNFWHMGRLIPNNAALNPSFIECAPATRIFQDFVQTKMVIAANHHLVARRPVSKIAQPRLV